MSFRAANPAGFSHLSPCLVELANKSISTCNGGGKLRSSYGGHADSNRPAIAANFRSQVQMKTLLWGVSAVVYPAFVRAPLRGLLMRPAAARSSASAAALRVTVSLQILFGNNAEKICPEPP
jgi:hypothetical protein